MPKARTVLPAPEDIKSILGYVPETGLVYWKIPRRYGLIKAGDPAGQQIQIQKKIYQSQRVAWCLAYNEWPDGTIFWKNGVRFDNRLSNLGLTPFAPKELTVEYLRKVLLYDQETGDFFWLVNERWAQYGELAGRIAPESGRRVIGLAGHIYQASRLAWFYVYGEWPTSDVDHWNGIADDNRINNLREANDSQNNANKKHANSNTGHRGIQKSWNRFTVTCNHKYLGTYATLDEAIVVRWRAEEEMQGEFAYSNRKK